MVLLSSCKKEASSDEDVITQNIDNLKVPTGFSWESSTDIYFDISVTDTRFGGETHVVSIYDADPAVGGKLLSKGSASTSASFLTKIYVSNTIKEVFVVKTAPDNSSSTQKVPINGLSLSVKLSGLAKDNSSAITDGKISGLSDSPDCTTGCTQTVSTSNSNLSVNDGQVLCITGNNITVSITGNGGTVRICGTNVTVQNMTLNNSAKLIITRTASVTFSNLNTNGTSSEFH